jgi:hypothetical protein
MAGGRLLGYTVGAFLCLAASAQATTGWAVQSGVGGDNALYRINLETGAATKIGLGVGYTQLRSLTFDAEGRLWGADDGADQLIRIDLQTGVGTPVASTVDSSVHTLEFDCAGRLLMVANPGSVYGLYTVNPTDASATLVGPTGVAVVGLASTQSALFGLTGSGTVGLGRINPATGAVTPVGSTNVADLQGGGLAAAVTGSLWAISSDASANIYSVDSATGQAILQSAVNPAGAGYGGLAIDAPSRCGPPAVSVTSGPEGLTNDSTPTFTFSAPPPGGSLQCGFDAALVPCGGQTTTAAPLADGPHSFDVKATARDGVAASAVRTFTVDTTPPQVEITERPPDLSADATPTFRFSSPEAGVGYACSIDGAAFAGCSGADASHSPTALADGSHTFSVVGTDAAGNAASPVSDEFVIDATAPDTQVDSGRVKTRKKRVKVPFVVEGQPATAACSFDRAAFAPCASPFRTPKMKRPSKHRLEIRSTDPAGNVEQTPALVTIKRKR